jgi:hypothetical protein
VTFGVWALGAVAVVVVQPPLSDLMSVAAFLSQH